MKVAILEVSAKTHYTLINALMKTYCINPNNAVVVYTIPSIVKTLEDGGLPSNARVIPLKEHTNVGNYLKDIEKTAFDRLHICTIEDYYKEFTAFKPNVKDIYFHVHNIDVWYESNTLNLFKNLIYKLKNKPEKIRSVARFLKDAIIRQPLKNGILAYFREKDAKYIVMSHKLKSYLAQFVDDTDDNIIVFPTLINENPETKHFKSQQNDKIRICIPGIVTNSRRDYSGLFKILNAILPDIKDKLVFDLLGYVDKKELHLLDGIKNLESKGLEIYYSLDFIDAVKFDEALAKADILLNNQTVTVSHTGQYGLTKDSGMLFNIVRGSKPAIFPKEYAVDKEFEEAIIFYNATNMDSLKDTLLGLAHKTTNLEAYKIKAIALANGYTPENLYGRLVKTDKLTTQSPKSEGFKTPI
jgi:hypothetical protein